uniref:USP domain-containing protein n=1 Tax=Heterorhabditis bacteriophora TaxID=37862 RepID=A0A1I7X3S5_HETBA
MNAANGSNMGTLGLFEINITYDNFSTSLRFYMLPKETNLSGIDVMMQIEPFRLVVQSMINAVSINDNMLLDDTRSSMTSSLQCHFPEVFLPNPTEDKFGTLTPRIHGHYFEDRLLGMSCPSCRNTKNNSYLQGEVKEDSKSLLSIATHLGIYKCNRLPFRIKSTPGIFQNLIDIIICQPHESSGVSRQSYSHDSDKQRTYNPSTFGFQAYLRLRIPLRIKCSFMMQQIKYLGYIINREVRRPELSLWTLLKKDEKFILNSNCQVAFDHVKNILQSDLLLTYYGLNKKIIVADDMNPRKQSNMLQGPLVME